MVKCYGIWYGGYSYTQPSVEHMEEFDSYADAERCLRSRLFHGNFALQTFRFVNGTNASVYCPAVDISETKMFIYDDPEGGLPERIISFGPRGGMKVEK